MGELQAALERAIERVGSVSTPRMNGDNLAVLLCGVFDDSDQPQDDDTGWSEAAVTGYEEVVKAIGDHFRTALSSFVPLGE